MSYEIKDSGQRKVFASGMQRDIDDDKIDYTYCVKGPMLDRWAVHMGKGAKKYDRDNWMKAAGTAELERFEGSALRHLIQWLRGDTDEDHAAAVFFNINGAEYVKARRRGEARGILAAWEEYKKNPPHIDEAEVVQNVKATWPGPCGVPGCLSCEPPGPTWAPPDNSKLYGTEQPEERCGVPDCGAPRDAWVHNPNPKLASTTIHPFQPVAEPQLRFSKEPVPMSFETIAELPIELLGALTTPHNPDCGNLGCDICYPPGDYSPGGK